MENPFLGKDTGWHPPVVRPNRASVTTYTSQPLIHRNPW